MTILPAADRAAIRHLVDTLSELRGALRDLANLAPPMSKSLQERITGLNYKVYAWLHDHDPKDVLAALDQAEQQREELITEISWIVRGFDAEARNGVICTPPDDEHGQPMWDAPPSRTWCALCRNRWARLRALPSKEPSATAVTDGLRPAPQSAESDVSRKQ